MFETTLFETTLLVFGIGLLYIPFYIGDFGFKINTSLEIYLISQIENEISLHQPRFLQLAVCLFEFCKLSIHTEYYS